MSPLCQTVARSFWVPTPMNFVIYCLVPDKSFSFTVHPLLCTTRKSQHSLLQLNVFAKPSYLHNRIFSAECCCYNFNNFSSRLGLVVWFSLTVLLWTLWRQFTHSYPVTDSSLSIPSVQRPYSFCHDEATAVESHVYTCSELGTPVSLVYSLTFTNLVNWSHTKVVIPITWEHLVW